jgi:hypothetical protein
MRACLRTCIRASKNQRALDVLMARHVVLFA